jgi:hypothetical protein
MNTHIEQIDLDRILRTSSIITEKNDCITINTFLSKNNSENQIIEICKSDNLSRYLYIKNKLRISNK